ncbi:hypothetical protein [Adlercreutzia sp. ZJ138]|uniref:coiled-coil domain-containing protein n=1 Tax=Adlercreutzia sp. ZJ138 TaxID=2709405 RepID=UPI001F14E954|nr:hypothetical protein [Adlercreutzia sp. ZJ138]
MIRAIDAKTKACGTRLLAAVMAFSLAVALLAVGCCLPYECAHADEVDDAQAVLDEAEASMAEISAEYDELAAKIAELQSQIDESITQVMAAQEEMLEGRAKLGETARYEYRSNTASAMLSVLLDSANFGELLRNVSCLDQIMDHHADEVAEQQARKAEFEEVSATLTFQKNEQERALAELEEKRAEAQQVVDDASAKLADAKESQASRLEALRAQAAAFAQSSAEGGAEIVENANTVDRTDAVPEGTPVAPNPAAGGTNSGNTGGSGNVAAPPSSGGGGASAGGASSGGSASAGWMTGVASAYGGSSDPYTPNPGITATGAVCDDNSMGVAVPMSLPGYRSYFGRTVEISYNGMTVYAVVNDCGYMGGGSRVLDLQPGVFKAFGYGDCYAWGLRTVSYRFL